MEEAVEARLRAGVQRFIQSDQPERVTIHALYGEGWDQVARRTMVGLEFGRLVADELIPGIKAVDRRDRINKNNHAEYVRRR